MAVDWNAYAAGVEKQLAQLRKDLEPLENGKLNFRSREYGGEWRDVTAEVIEQNKAAIKTYETILEDVKSRRI